ncbi:Exodeoxyribonuclease I subunit D [Modicisalibacter ilicicola DSM 19980]|uniref:Nuclease SbcCD subunit D n=1 Tax=Modicisalibacter ilicicola DSM 19980 TaxID=1121942 RepID=A0A1M4XZB9_9GAMM|nr:exonuclease SbcCD subunit D C-terminal domain-containing protein [Halomonas ilicicola]SHE98643.1 Exodeoxyribonuclease I subunit D [Halomonas ilicicola DSM 19980]
MKLFHTADWHLGQTFHGQERHDEHRAFLDWLLDTLAIRQPDALLIAGDIFDVVNPSLRAQELLYDFIVGAHERLPTLEIVMIAGNHDSGSRIELPAPLMQRLHAHARGRVQWRDDGELDAERLLIPLHDAQGEIRAWCLALPFLRPAEVTGGDIDDYVEGIARVHRELIEAARARRRPGQALVAMSHAHLQGASVSENSERPIVIGGEEALPASLFPEDIAYVALGHLHRPQRVGEDRIRYSGTPLPMDFSESHYPHQVVEITLEDEALASVESLPIPRAVELRRVGPAPLEQALQELGALEGDASLPRQRWPWLEVRVELTAPCPDLRARVEAALDGKPLRLLRIHTRFPDSEDDTRESRVTLDSLGPRELFMRTWHKRYGSEPTPRIREDFDRLLQAVQDGEEDAGVARP